MDSKAFQIESGLYQQYLALVKEYGFEFAEDLYLYEIPVHFADLVNKNIYQNPEYDKNNKKIPAVYPFLKLE